MSAPSPTQVYLELRNAIAQDKRPADMLHKFLSSGSKEANYLGNTILENKPALKLLTSPQGRAWFHRWADDTLDFLKKISEAP